MRNVFDQYKEPENRLTHSLVVALEKDPRLLKAFLKWTVNKSLLRSDYVEIVEQKLFGVLDADEEEAERRGLPDGWISVNEEWCLLIESKIESSLDKGQLKRHYRTAERCGFSEIIVLAIESSPRKIKLEDWVLRKTWSEIYTWLISMRETSDWACYVSEYFEIAESKLSEIGHLTKGKLTVFSGIPFDQKRPYTYVEGKRVLKLILEEIREDKSFCKKVSINPRVEGRGAIKGKQATSVWDYLTWKGAKAGDAFTKNPHFTIGINSDCINIAVTIPNGIQAGFRRNLAEIGYERFKVLVGQVISNMKPLIKADEAFTPWCIAIQRRYPSQSAEPFKDAVLEFDPRTAFQGEQVKTQEQWLKTSYDIFCSKKSNYQFQIGSITNYKRSTLIKDKKILGQIKGTWLACRPVLDVLVSS
jgi:hypothetical protein